MTARWLRAVFAVVLTMVLAVLLAIAGSWAAAHAAVRATRTCTARAVTFDGPYRVYNDQFASTRQRLCLRTDGTRLTTLSSVRPAADGVVWYPAVQYGPYYGWADASTSLPAPTRSMPRLDLHVSSTGGRGGPWDSDVDAWYFPAGSHGRAHGNAEIVIVTRTSAGGGSRAGRLLRFGGRAWYFDWWLTCPAALGGKCWPLERFTAARQFTSGTLSLRQFVWHARRFGWLPRAELQGDISYGSEIWAGGRGLTDSMRITGAYPPPGGKS